MNPERARERERGARARHSFLLPPSPSPQTLFTSLLLPLLHGKCALVSPLCCRYTTSVSLRWGECRALVIVGYGVPGLVRRRLLSREMGMGPRRGKSKQTLADRVRAALLAGSHPLPSRAVQAHAGVQTCIPAHVHAHPHPSTPSHPPLRMPTNHCPHAHWNYGTHDSRSWQ